MQQLIQTLLTIQERAFNGHECTFKSTDVYGVLGQACIEQRGCECCLGVEATMEGEIWWPAGYTTCPGLLVQPVQQ